jgi:hypothetical protein
MGSTSIGILTLLITFQASAGTQRVRRVLAPPDQIVTVKTAIGIATIIQVPDRPNSLVVGDTEAFKVEYLDQAITIKPLHAGAKSNLYIYTDYRRFNVQLITGAEAAADYVVYLEVPKEKENFKQPASSLQWTKIQASMKNDSISFDVKRLGRTKDGILIIEFSLRPAHREKFDPKWVWLTQNGITKPIHRLMLSRLDLNAKSANDGMVQILRSDINETRPFRLELRRKKTSYLTIPEVTSWK